MHLEATITSKGQLTIPAPLRTRWGLHEGDKVDFYLDEVSGMVQIVPRNGTLSELVGFLKVGQAHAAPASQEDIDRAVTEQVTADQERLIAESAWLQKTKENNKQKIGAAK
jgi:antitoxin PrlF